MLSQGWPRTQGQGKGVYSNTVHLVTIFDCIGLVWGELYPTNALMSEEGRNGVEGDIEKILLEKFWVCAMGRKLASS